MTAPGRSRCRGREMRLYPPLLRQISVGRSCERLHHLGRLAGSRERDQSGASASEEFSSFFGRPEDDWRAEPRSADQRNDQETAFWQDTARIVEIDRDELGLGEAA